MSRHTKTAAIVVAAVIVGAVAHEVAGQEALALGMSGLELFLLSAAAGAVIKRTGVA